MYISVWDLSRYDNNQHLLVEMVPSRMLLAANGHMQPQGYLGECGVELAENKAHKEESSQAYDHKPVLQHTLL